MCKDCKCKKTLDFSDMALELLKEFVHIMPLSCFKFLEDVRTGKDVQKIYGHTVKTKYPLH